MHATNCIKISATLRSLRAEIRKSSGATPPFACPLVAHLIEKFEAYLSEREEERESEQASLGLVG